MTQIAGAGVLLTGASRGIGAATAIELARRGARQVLVARDGDALEALAAGLRGEGAEAHVVVADMAQQDEVRAMVASARSHLGAIDVLINNAGLGLSGPVKDIRPEDLRYVFEVNVVAPHIATTEVLPEMLKRRAGHIVNMGSVASHVAAPALGGYSATKFALKALTDALRMEVRRHRVRVTLICPGPIRTDFVASVRGQREGHLPTKPVGVPVEDAARCVARAIQRNRAEAFVPLYYQGLVGVNSAVPQVWRAFGERAWRMSTNLVERLG